MSNDRLSRRQVLEGAGWLGLGVLGLNVLGCNSPGGGPLVGKAEQIGLVRAAGQCGLAGADASEQAGRALNVHRFTVVAGTEQGDVGVAQAETLGRRGHQWHGLQWFERRAREHRVLDVATGGDQPAIGRHNGKRPMVDVLGMTAAKTGGDGCMAMQGLLKGLDADAHGLRIS